jgi:selenide,water dikinase
MIPAGCYQNRSFYLDAVLAEGCDPDRLLPLYDPQTSGGLLIALSAEQAEVYQAMAQQRGVFVQKVGEVVSRRTHPLILR